MKQGVKFLGGALLAAFLLWVVLRGKDPVAIRAALAQASITGLLIAGAVNLAHNVFRVIRWGLLLTPVRAKIPFRPRWSAVIIGYLTTWVIPGRLGEVVRPALLSAREKLPLGPCLGSVLADRLLDGAAIVLLFALGTALSPFDASGSRYAEALRATAVGLVIFLAVAFTMVVAAGIARKPLAAWVERRSSPIVQWVGRTFLSLTDGTEALRKPRLLMPILVHSLLAWATIALGTWIGVRAAGVDVPFAATLVLLPPLALGVALPTPGGAGGYHAAMSLGLVHLFGVPEASAVSAGILMHLMVTLPVIGLGLILLKADGLAWSDISGIVRQVGALGSKAPAVLPAEVVR